MITVVRTCIFLCVLALPLFGCNGAGMVTGPLDDIKYQRAELAKRPYIIGRGDELELKFFYAPELNDKATVRPDGKITVALLGDVQAAGRSPMGLAGTIESRLKDKVKQPSLTITLRSMGSNRAFVGGEVLHPGPVALMGRETVLSVLNQAGWVTPFAGNDKIALLRRNDDGDLQRYMIDVDALISGDDLTQDVYIQAGDFVLVPPSGSVSADRWVDQNIRQILPFSTGASATYAIRGANNQ